MLATPEGSARHVFLGVWRSLLVSTHTGAVLKVHGEGFPPETLHDWERDAYSMEQARSDLGVAVRGRDEPRQLNQEGR